MTTLARLWAPWRSGYVRSTHKKKEKGCIFCSAAGSPQEKFVVARTRHSRVMLNRFPYNNGHLMVSPRRHVADLALLSDDELLDLFKTVNRAKKALHRLLKPAGYNIGVNIGREAGAGIVSHVHVHIVPRWAGDTNFMPVVAGTKVVSQSLAELKRLLKKNLC